MTRPPRALATPSATASLAGYFAHFNKKGARIAPDARFGFKLKCVQAL